MAATLLALAFVALATPEPTLALLVVDGNAPDELAPPHEEEPDTGRDDTRGDAPPLLDTLDEGEFPPAPIVDGGRDDADGASDDEGRTDAPSTTPPPDASSSSEDPWPISTTVGTAVGCAIPNVVFGGVGTGLLGVGLGLVWLGVAEGGCAGVILIIYGLVIAVVGAPLLLLGAVLTPIAGAIGALVGGAFGGRFAWPSALGALMGFVPAVGAVAALAATWGLVEIMSTAQGDPLLFQMGAVGTFATTVALVLATGPTTLAGAALGEWLVARSALPDDDGRIDGADDGPRAPPRDGDDDVPASVDDEALRGENARAVPTDEEGAPLDAPPPLLDPQAMRF